ncbi:hypothetical protein D3C75_770230 [compost metagenome]
MDQLRGIVDGVGALQGKRAFLRRAGDPLLFFPIGLGIVKAQKIVFQRIVRLVAAFNAHAGMMEEYFTGFGGIGSAVDGKGAFPFDDEPDGMVFHHHKGPLPVAGGFLMPDEQDGDDQPVQSGGQVSDIQHGLPPIEGVSESSERSRFYRIFVPGKALLRRRTGGYVKRK